MNATPSVAPFQPCVSCMRGDTTTVVTTQGSPAWHATILHKLGLPVEEAVGTFELAADQFGGIANDEPVNHRVCSLCAQSAGFKITPEEMGTRLVYAEPVAAE